MMTSQAKSAEAGYEALEPSDRLMQLSLELTSMACRVGEERGRLLLLAGGHVQQAVVELAER